MAGPWEDYAPAAQAATDNAPPWMAFQTGPNQNLPMQPWKGGVLPVSSDSEGNIKFDPTAGLLGSLLGGFSAASDLGKYAVEGGGLSPDQLVDKSREAAAMFTPMAPVTKLRAALAADVAAPSADALRSAASQGYNAVRDAGVDYNPSAVSQMAGGLRSDLENNYGISAELAPKSFGILGKLENPPAGSVAAPISGIEAARRSFGQAAKDFSNPTEQLAAQKLREGLENFVANPPQSAVPPGQFNKAIEAAGLLSDARANYAAAKRSEALGKISDDAELNAKVANSGLNLDNTLRQRVAAILKDPKKSAGFNDEELAALNEVATGTPTRNVARYVSNLLGGGGSLGAIISGAIGGAAGGAAGGPIGMVVGTGVPALGLLTKKWTGAATERSLNAADELVRQRSPLNQGLLADAAPVPVGGLLAPLAVRGGLLAVMNDPRRPSNSMGY